MEPFTPDLNASDDRRREAALDKLLTLIKEGIEAESQRARANSVFGVLSEETIETMLSHLSAYSTEALEYTAELRSSPNAPRPYLHRIFRNMEGWREATGGHSDMMFRDVVSLRRITVPLNHWDAFPFFETYKATGIPIGELHKVGFNRQRDVAEALILVARLSRMSEQKGLRDGIKGIRQASPYDSIQNMRDRLKESYGSEQLTEEWITYLTDKPEQRSAVCDYLLEQKLPLREVSAQHFEEYTAAHTVLKVGVL